MSKVPVSSTSTYSSSALRAEITTSLISNGSIPVIQGALLHELQASGWTAALRNYITQLMRSGECTKYDELMEKVLEATMVDVVNEKKKSNGVNGQVAKKGTEGLRIPESAMREGVKVVRRELEKVCETS